MDILTEEQIAAHIRSGKCFSGTVDSGGFHIEVKRYVPVLATAIHDGHRVIEPFAGKMQVSDAERQFEEDPYTADIAESMDISIKVCDSRYFCDLNRSEEKCLYKEAWGKQVWKEPLGEDDKEQLLKLHHSYYRILDVLLSELIDRFGAVVMYDLHSYNYRRINGSPPLFNIGTNYIDMTRFGSVIDHLIESLQTIVLPDCENRAVLDEVFVGKGYQAEFTHQHYKDVLCVPLELKKVFMEEQSFELIDKISAPLFAGTEQALKGNAEFFIKTIAAERGDNAGH